MPGSSHVNAQPSEVVTPLAGYQLLGDSLPEQGHRVHRTGARRLRAARPAAAARRHARRAGVAAAAGAARLRHRSRALRVPARTAGHQRDGVLRAAHPQHRGAAADRLHADGRRRLPAFQPAVPQAARAVPELAAPQAHQADPLQSAVRPHRGDRRHRRRAHPRPRRPGRRRHGHPDRQARALHRLRRHPSLRPRCRSFSTSAPTTTSGWPIRSTSAGGTSGCAARNTTSSSRSSSPRRPSAGRTSCCSGRTSPRRTRRGCSTAIATGSAPSTTTSRAPRRSRPGRCSRPSA